MAMDAFVSLNTDGGRGNDGAGAKPSGGNSRPARPILRAVVRMAAEVAAQPVRWLWEGQLALGKIAVVAGAANVGKSLLVTGDFAARVSVGADWPDGSTCPVGDVLIASGYDGAADTIVPRLLDHGADLRRVHFLQGFARADVCAAMDDPGPSGRGAHLLLTPGGLPLLERALRPLPEVKLVVFDPVSAFLDSAGNGTKARHVLSALQALAERCGAAFVLVAGLRDSAARGRLAVAGPAGLVSAARHLWVVARDRTAGQRRLFMPAKNNLGGESRGYAWMIADGKVRWEPGQLERAGYFDTLVEAGHRSVAQRDAAAAAFIADFLKDGPRGWAPITLQGKAAGHKAGT